MKRKELFWMIAPCLLLIITAPPVWSKTAAHKRRQHIKKAVKPSVAPHPQTLRVRLLWVECSDIPKSGNPDFPDDAPIGTGPEFGVKVQLSHQISDAMRKNLKWKSNFVYVDGRGEVHETGCKKPWHFSWEGNPKTEIYSTNLCAWMGTIPNPVKLRGTIAVNDCPPVTFAIPVRGVGDTFYFNTPTGVVRSVPAGEEPPKSLAQPSPPKHWLKNQYPHFSVPLHEAVKNITRDESAM